MTEDLIFIIGNKPARINDLEHAVNADFLSLYESTYGLPAFDVNKFKRSSFDFFDTIKTATNNFAKHDDYFNNFINVWRTLLDQQKYKHAEELWKFALDIALEWEQKNVPMMIHKGTPYYFWAVTCFLNDDIDKGFSLMHQAYEEDESTFSHGGANNPADLPAGLFLYFVPANNAQFFKPKLDMIKRFLEDCFINNYVNNRTRTFSYAVFEQKFLRSANEVTKEVKFHFNLNLFRLEKILNRFPYTSEKNTISSLLYMETIFDLCRVLEFIIKNTTRENFSKDIRDFSKKYKPNTLLDRVVSSDFNTKEFMITLQDILNSNYKIDSSIPDNLECDILITYGFRNFGAHKIEEHSLIVNNFGKIIRSIMNAIFLAIELYL